VSHVAVDLVRAAEQIGLRQRLDAIPLSAHSRGIFFNMLRDDLARRGLLEAPEIGNFSSMTRDRTK
jgi:hypothetical protein